MAYCRVVLADSGVKFCERFQRKLADGQLSAERPLDSDPLWAATLSFAWAEKRSGVSRESLLVVAARSAEFDAVNQLAKRGTKLDDIVLTPTLFQWQEDGRRMTTSRLALAIIAVVASILLFPFKQTIAPEWTIYALGADRHPLANITVREVWQQYSLENEGHEEDRLTDSSGRVQFPRRNLRSSISQRLIGCFKQVMMTGVHASCGAKSYLVAFGKGVDTMDWADFSQEQGTTMPWQHSTLVLKH